MVKYIDAHAHVNFCAFDDDRDTVIARTLEEGVWMINVGTQQHTSRTAVELAEQYAEGVYAIVGLHPIHTSKSYHDEQEIGGDGAFTSRGEVFDTAYYRKLVAHPRVVGIGECGLDYYRTEPDSQAKQKDALIAQVELALEADVPLMMHTRPDKKSMQAYRDTLDILEGYSKEYGEKLRGNFHFFAGNMEIVKRVLALGFTCSFTGVITFARDYDAVAQYVPNDMLLAETDCPYVTPEPHRNERNEPRYVKYVVAALAQIRKTQENVLREHMVHNTARLFQLPL